MVRMLLLLLLVVAVVLVVVRLSRAPVGRGRSFTDAPVPEVPADVVVRARQELEQAQKSYAARVRSAEQALARARQDTEVLRLGPVVLGRCTVFVSGHEHDLTQDTRFEFGHEGDVTYRVDPEGAGSRIVEDDRRSGRLVVAGADWEEAVHVMPADFPEAERLVAAGRAVTGTVAAARRERTERMELAWAELEEARAARTEVDEARMTLEDLQGSGPRVWDVPEPPEDE